MENTLNSGSLETLKFGETLLVNARKVKNDKIHLEFAEIINNQSAVNVLGLLNKSIKISKNLSLSIPSKLPIR